ncbi:MAG TPA: right-handed parallel beta-helix repeat-containing protein [Dokdonella sp.]|uniref:beta strand repeat-containing protein n=1 Tax=Dokdonella sp. TaxID=2291710 RepID=UPI002D7EE626|nr:right-handed parallel beta-helix repeat-containing protein [Dokdonella sp.]HET9031877.1 right-handed parallel beta-helix repeat-containing protein [Dokdonella sp.]
MKSSIASVIALAALFLADPVHAATFTIGVIEDDSGAHDINPGDGICRDSFNSCTLRAAIEEANANAGTDTILFADSFTNVTVLLNAVEGPLPPVTGRVNILGSSIDAYNSAATLLRNAPPQFFIDGSALPAGNSSGLIFSGAGASASIVSAIGIVGFPGNGILAAFGADNLIIERNFIGVRANGSAAGNGGHGVHAASSGGHRIGKARNGAGTAFTSLGNVLSSNGLSGVRLESSNDNDLRGNLIGIAPSGTSDRGNGNYGIHISGTNNDIGDYIASASAGNYLAGNNLGGILSVGNSNRFYANTLGTGETGGFITSEADGIVVIGNTNFIGNSNRGRNRIVEHTTGSAIRLGAAGGTAADNNFVLNNEVGSAGSQFPILFSANAVGIHVANGNTNAILNNVVINSRGSSSPNLFGYGIAVRGNDNTISGNQVGFVASISGPVAEPNERGIFVAGLNNTLGSAASPNQVGGNSGYGISTSGNGNAARFNYVGVTNTFADIGNGTYGLVMANGAGIRAENNVIGNNILGLLISQVTDSPNVFGNYVGITPGGDDIGNSSNGVWIVSSSNIDLQQNRISYNGGSGIATDAYSSGIAWFQNRMYGNGDIGIDLGSDGPTANDPGDVDEGPNRLQNFPVIQQVILDSVAFPPTLTISYRVDSNSGASGYPLFVDFYWSDLDEPAQGRFFLGTDFSYSTPNALRTVTLNFVDGVPGGWLTATALDQDRNTSELAARFQFGNPFDRIFADGFE